MNDIVITHFHCLLYLAGDFLRVSRYVLGILRTLSLSLV